MQQFVNCCRLCLTESSPNLVNCLEISDLCEAVEEVFGFQILASDRCSTQICRKCIDKVTSIGVYRQLVLSNQKLITKYDNLQSKILEIGPSIKSEDTDVIFVSYTVQPFITNNEHTAETLAETRVVRSRFKATARKSTTQLPYHDPKKVQLILKVMEEKDVEDVYLTRSDQKYLNLRGRHKDNGKTNRNTPGLRMKLLKRVGDKNESWTRIEENGNSSAPLGINSKTAMQTLQDCATTSSKKSSNHDSCSETIGHESLLKRPLPILNRDNFIPTSSNANRESKKYKMSSKPSSTSSIFSNEKITPSHTDTIASIQPSKPSRPSSLINQRLLHLLDSSTTSSPAKISVELKTTPATKLTRISTVPPEIKAAYVEPPKAKRKSTSSAQPKVKTPHVKTNSSKTASTPTVAKTKANSSQPKPPPPIPSRKTPQKKNNKTQNSTSSIKSSSSSSNTSRREKCASIKETSKSHSTRSSRNSTSNSVTKTKTSSANRISSLNSPLNTAGPSIATTSTNCFDSSICRKKSARENGPTDKSDSNNTATEFHNSFYASTKPIQIALYRLRNEMQIKLLNLKNSHVHFTELNESEKCSVRTSLMETEIKKQFEAAIRTAKLDQSSIELLHALGLNETYFTL